MIKDPESRYTPGRQGLAWLKLKKAFATLDCAVIGAEYGHGKRSQVLSDYSFAVRDDDTGALVTIGKAYTGLTDAEIANLTEHFLRTSTRQQGRYFEVPPDTVLEIAFDLIQPSTRHSSGLALRFPRIVRLRSDKTLADIDTLSTARRLASGNPAANLLRQRGAGTLAPAQVQDAGKIPSS
jgi:DNA ligase 1